MASTQQVSTVTLRLYDGRSLRVHTSGSGAGADAPTILWHHGSPQTGAILAPLREAATARGIRLVSYGRPGYGGSSELPGRTVASAAHDVERILDALDITSAAMLAASGGTPHALACGALLPGRVSALACLGSMAPFGADGLDWFAGMATGGASLRAATQGRRAKELYESTAEFDPDSFVDRDYAALDSQWSALSDDVQVAAAAGNNGLIADDLAFVAPWGFNVVDVLVPVLLAQGGRDRVLPLAHSQWLLEHLPDAELWLRPHDGHVSILDASALAMDWLVQKAPAR
ncbi:MAG: alpha/beta hydrolase [Glaciihabitans sp.]|nr:alpha/beta hydrolase [Glaciihabitans sp.]